MTDPIDSWPTGRLLSTAARLVEHEWAEALDARGLTHAGLVVLHFLDAGALNQSELARSAKVEAQTMSRTIERLERRGLVRREADPLDRRRLVVTRTAEGDGAWASTRLLESDVFPAVSNPAQLRARLLEIIHASSKGRW